MACAMAGRDMDEVIVHVRITLVAAVAVAVAVEERRSSSVIVSCDGVGEREPGAEEDFRKRDANGIGRRGAERRRGLGRGKEGVEVRRKIVGKGGESWQGGRGGRAESADGRVDGESRAWKRGEEGERVVRIVMRVEEESLCSISVYTSRERERDLWELTL